VDQVDVVPVLVVPVEVDQVDVVPVLVTRLPTSKAFRELFAQVDQEYCQANKAFQSLPQIATIEATQPG
jgi:hypothetical protein